MRRQQWDELTESFVPKSQFPYHKGPKWAKKTGRPAAAAARKDRGQQYYRLSTVFKCERERQLCYN